uniref:Small acidic protein n=1 Tax=Panagrellus redivivus TaxID=6233 RepID=A0A7E4W2Z7_PANRE
MVTFPNTSKNQQKRLKNTSSLHRLVSQPSQKEEAEAYDREKDGSKPGLHIRKMNSDQNKQKGKQRLRQMVDKLTLDGIDSGGFPTSWERSMDFGYLGDMGS